MAANTDVHHNVNKHTSVAITWQIYHQKIIKIASQNMRNRNFYYQAIIVCPSESIKHQTL